MLDAAIRSLDQRFGMRLIGARNQNVQELTEPNQRLLFVRAKEIEWNECKAKEMIGLGIAHWSSDLLN